MGLEALDAGTAGISLRSAYQQLALSDPYAVEAAYRLIGLELAPAAGTRVSRSTGAGATAFVVVDDGQPVGAMTIATDPVLSEHFGFGCAAMDWYCSEQTERGPVLKSLLKACNEHLRSAGVSHVSIRVTSGDFEATTAIQDAGAFLADTMMTYIVRTVSEERELQFEAQAGELNLLAVFGKDLPRVDKSISEYFATLVEAFYPLSRFHADPHFDSALASALYGKWCRKAFAGEWADGVLMARHEEDPVGFICWKRDDVRSELLGCEFFGSGLGASSGYGSYSTMLDAACESSHFRWAEFDLHVANAPVLRAVGRHPQARQVRAYHTFHFWLGNELMSAA